MPRPARRRPHLRESMSAAMMDEHVDDDETAEQFFSSHPPPALALPDENDEPAIDMRRSLVPPARRARHLRIVKASVLVCAFLCVAAGLRVVTVKGPSEVQAAQPLAALTIPMPRVEPAPTVAPPPPPAPVPAAESAPAPAVDPRWPDAHAATRAAVVALEAHRVDAAIDAATAATNLDPADGEAWLMLGAAYQDRGKLALAVDAYRTCKAQGRSDPRGECGAMLRSLGALSSAPMIYGAWSRRARGLRSLPPHR